MPIRLFNQNMDEDEHMSLPQLLALGKVWSRRDQHTISSSRTSNSYRIAYR